MMKLRYFLTILYIVALTVFQSCNPYQKLLKSDDVALKYQKAEEYYNKKDFQRALPLLEDLLTYYRGTAQAEKIYFYLADTYFQMGNYQLASYQFKTFADAYPLSAYAEKAYYYYAYSLYSDSPRKDLDQGNTQNAINAFKLFISKYPESTRVDEVNKNIDELTQKLEEKAIDNAMMYYKIQNYKSAVWALREVLNEYPATKEREKLEYYIVKSSYTLAEKSVEAKQRERYLSTIQYYNEFREKFPKSGYDGELNRIYKDSSSQIDKLKNKRS
jgi:outer membrane protein assembly factor BamD